MRWRFYSFAALFVLLAAVVGNSGCGGTERAQSGSVSGTVVAQTTTTIVTMQAQGTYEKDTLRLDSLARLADIVLVGTVQKQLPGQWNSAPGATAPDTSNEDIMPIIYTTWLIEVKEVLLGKAAAGEVVAFRSEGGAVGSDGKGGDTVLDVGGSASSSWSVGDQVLVFGFKNDTRYGGYYKPEGYWLVADALSVYKFDDSGEYVRSVPGPFPSEDSVDLTNVRGLMNEAAEARGLPLVSPTS